MAKLYEYQSKSLLRDGGIRVPEGGVVSTPAEARALAAKIGRPVVLKIQVWLTGRAGLGGIQFAATPEEAEAKAASHARDEGQNYVVDRLLVEERLRDQGRVLRRARHRRRGEAPGPRLQRGRRDGGRGDRPAPSRQDRPAADRRHGRPRGIRGPQPRPQDRAFGRGPDPGRRPPDPALQGRPGVRRPLGRDQSPRPDRGRPVYAADCHLVVDDYAVFRHPELGIEIAREFDRPPTELERIAYKVEEKDYRGTFYFFQMADTIGAGEAFIGFHGAGGGGSMMSMDAVLGQGLQAGQLLRHERQSAGEQGLPGGQDHPLPARHPRLFRLGLGRRQPGAVQFGPRPGQGLHRGEARHPGRHPPRRQLRGGGHPDPRRPTARISPAGSKATAATTRRNSAPAGSRPSSARARARATPSGRSRRFGRARGRLRLRHRDREALHRPRTPARRARRRAASRPAPRRSSSSRTGRRSWPSPPRTRRRASAPSAWPARSSAASTRRTRSSIHLPIPGLEGIPGQDRPKG